MPGPIHKPGGPIGVVSRSGTLTYEVVHQLTQQGIGQTTCIGIGGDPVNGTNFIDCLRLFRTIRPPGGSSWWARSAVVPKKKRPISSPSTVTKPVIGFIAGLTAPPGRRMGHAGAIISGKSGTAEGKLAAMQAAGIHICKNLGELGELSTQVFKGLF
jgi:succinyl-CoA synthetase alpha subunit